MKETPLECLFDNLNWERKFEYLVPDFESCRQSWVYTNSYEDVEKCHAKLTGKFSEETNKYVRSCYLFTDSVGQKLAILENTWAQCK